VFILLEWIVGEGICPSDLGRDNDPDTIFLDLACLLEIETADEARAALAEDRTRQPSKGVSHNE
jgi:hypothetical protein